MAVNYISPPYCRSVPPTTTEQFDYVRILLHAVERHPDYAQMNFRLVVLLALDKAHPKSECG